jgi:hypothetical protein
LSNTPYFDVALGAGAAVEPMAFGVRGGAAFGAVFGALVPAGCPVG